MTKYLHVLFLFLVSVTTFAQRVDSVAAGDRPKTYVPGRWSVGLRYDFVPVQVKYRATYATGVTVGYNLLPRLSVQLGLTPTNLRRLGRKDLTLPAPLMPPFDTYTGPEWDSDFRPGLYVPLTLRYSFSKPFRRVQSYLTANLHAYLGGVRSIRYDYENGQLTNAPAETLRWRNNALGTAVGFGVRIRTVDRFFLSGELGLGRTYQQNTMRIYDPGTGRESRVGHTQFTALLGVGVTYEFR